MFKKKEQDSLEDQKEALFEAIDELRNSIDLEDLDLRKIQEWAIPLLVAVFSAYLAYKLLKDLFGTSNVEVHEGENGRKKVKVKRDSSVSRLLKEQLLLILVAVLRKRVVRYLRENNFIDEEEHL
ncbi:MAG: hypothetical protein ACLFUB_09570 [Cyclobacteriaceae bacterium]